MAVPRRRQAGRPTGLAAAMATLSDELALFRARLDAAGLQVAGLLSAADVVTATRGRSDPAGMEQLATLPPVAGRRGRGGGADVRPVPRRPRS